MGRLAGVYIFLAVNDLLSDTVISLGNEAAAVVGRGRGRTRREEDRSLQLLEMGFIPSLARQTSLIFYISHAVVKCIVMHIYVPFAYEVLLLKRLACHISKTNLNLFLCGARFLLLQQKDIGLVEEMEIVKRAPARGRLFYILFFHPPFSKAFESEHSKPNILFCISKK